MSARTQQILTKEFIKEHTNLNALPIKQRASKDTVLIPFVNAEQKGAICDQLMKKLFDVKK